VITPELLHGWAQRLSHFTGGSCAEAAACLGVRLVRDPSHESALLAVPPPGAVSAKLVDGPADVTDFFFVELELEPPGLTLAQLQPVLGPGRTLPRTGAFASYNHVFELDFAGSPSFAYVTATFRANPKQGASATTVSVRRGSRT
jgi:hypothetical protein